MSSSISTRDRGVKLPKNIEELLSKLKNDSTLKLNDTENYVLVVNNKMYDKLTISLSETIHSMESYAEEKSAFIQKSTEAKRKGMDQCTTTLKTLAEVQSKMNTLDTSKELTAFGRECKKQFLKEVTTLLTYSLHLYDFRYSKLVDLLIFSARKIMKERSKEDVSSPVDRVLLCHFLNDTVVAMVQYAEVQP